MISVTEKVNVEIPALSIQNSISLKFAYLFHCDCNQNKIKNTA